MIGEIFKLFILIFNFVLFPISVILIFKIFGYTQRSEQEIKELSSEIDKLRKSIGLLVAEAEFPEEFKDRMKKVLKNIGEDSAFALIKEEFSLEDSQVRLVFEKILA